MGRRGAVLTLLVLLAGALPASAGGVKIIVGGHSPSFHTHRHHTRPTHGVKHGHTQAIPGVVYVVPGPPAHCLVPGYWTYQWVPQAHFYNVWVPGQWSPEGRWIEGHYAPYAYHTGYYQPVWVPDRRIC